MFVFVYTCLYAIRSYYVMYVFVNYITPGWLESRDRLSSVSQTYMSGQYYGAIKYELCDTLYWFVIVYDNGVCFHRRIYVIYVNSVTSIV